MRRSRLRWRTTLLGLSSAAAFALTWQTGSAARQQTPAPGSAPAVPATGTAAPAPARGGGFRPPEPLDDEDRTGWTQIFDGKTLNGWDGNPLVWKVEDGAITAESTAERRVGTTYIIWRGGEPADFELKLEIRAGLSIHSAVFYRSRNAPPAPRAGGAGAAGGGRAAGTGTAGTPGPPAPAGAAGTAPAATPTGRAAQPPPAIPADPRWNVIGEGLDFDYPQGNNGNVQDVGAGRTDVMIGWRGDVVRAENGKRPRRLAVIGDHDALAEKIRQGDWNQIHIIARGNVLTHIINGHLMALMFDDDTVAAKTKGVVALQVESGVGKISFRNIWLKQ